MILSLIPFVSGIVTKEKLAFEIGLVVFAAGCGLSLMAVILAVGIKCVVCQKRPSVIFRNSEAKYWFKPKNEIEALLNDFYPIEIRESKFRCVHCGTEYFLK